MLRGLSSALGFLAQALLCRINGEDLLILMRASTERSSKTAKELVKALPAFEASNRSEYALTLAGSLPIAVAIRLKCLPRMLL